MVPVSGLAGEHSWLIWFFLALNGLAAAIGQAVVRYRLWDIHRIISRTLAYAIVTGLLVGVYAGLVAALDRHRAQDSRAGPEREVAPAPESISA